MAEAKNAKGTLLDAAAEFEKIEAMKERLNDVFIKHSDPKQSNDVLRVGMAAATAYAELVKAQAALG